MTSYYNPYTNLNFIEVIGLFFKRLFTGSLTLESLASDEIQLLVLIFISASAAMVGTFLYLRKEVMLANAFSHTILIGIVGVYLFAGEEVMQTGLLPVRSMFVASVFTGVGTAFLVELLARYVRLQEDASIGLVFTTLFAAGVILLTLLTKNTHIGTAIVMGNVDGLQLSDLKLAFWIFILNLVLITLFFKEFKITTFDPAFASILGFSTLFYNYLMMTEVSITAVGAFRAVGVLMVIALIVGPPFIARLFVDRLKPLLLLSVGIGLLASLSGVALSRHLLTTLGTPYSTGGLVVTLIALFSLLSALFAPKRGLLRRHSS